MRKCWLKKKEKKEVGMQKTVYLPAYLPTDPVWRSVKESIVAVRPVQIDN
jgi:hypothetical protein